MTTPNTPANEANNHVAEPVNWIKKGNKLTVGNVADLMPDANLNIRNRMGSEAFGVKFEKDTLDIPGMKIAIMEMGGILEPIMVSVREVLDASGKKILQKIVLRGNRRTYAGQELLKDPNLPAAIRKSLTENTPMTLLYGLTPEQEREKVQDQTQKDFLRSEFVKHIFALRREKMDWKEIAWKNFMSLPKFTGSHEKLREVEEILDPVAKKEKIELWAKGTLLEYLINGYDLGEFVRKQILMSEMRLDGSLLSTGEQPWFYTKVKGGTAVKVDSQKRIRALKKAWDADQGKPGFQSAIRPTEAAIREQYEFWKQVEEFHNLDYGITTVAAKPAAGKMMGKAALEKIEPTYSSRAVKAIIARILTDKDVADLQMRDEFAAMMESKGGIVSHYLHRLNPETAKIIRLIFVNPDANDFQAYLESQMVVEEEINAPSLPAENVGDSITEGNEYNLTDATE